MKHNKTLGIDGFPAEFLKVFWGKIILLITRVLNYSYKKGKLPISLRQSIINCLPKGDKSRELLKNWRPISLLSVLYKLTSATLANRMKKVLDKLISDSQTGFLKRRYIGESIRLVYDIINYCNFSDKKGLLMLIDFEKAFDSISWKFMYKVLKFFKFPSGYIKWIKILNTSTVAAVIQCGVKSDFVPVERGCKQGDPIAPYLYILGGQIMCYMIDYNLEINGIYVCHKEFKISQFADDMALFLDGSQNSLQAAINTIELFGSFSGLKMNTNKTKVIWIGRKKHIIEKFNVNCKLDWNTSQFNLLGVELSTDLKMVPQLNYTKAMTNLLKVLKQWKKRELTPIGKATIIKTFLLSKFNHLFISIPAPDDCFIKRRNSLLFSYLWGDKPDKIKRKYIALDYLEGGLRMVNLNYYIKSLKLLWMARLFKTKLSGWIQLFELVISPVSKMTKFGYGWSEKLRISTKKQFWKEFLEAWIELCELKDVETSDQFLSSPIWYNPKISAETLHFPKWFKHGIELVGDLIDKDGKFISELELASKFNLTGLNVLEILRLKILINQYLRKTRVKLENFVRPHIPSELVALITRSTKSNFFTTCLINRTQT